MYLRTMPAFLFILAFSVSLLFAQASPAVKPGPLTPEEGKTMVQQKKDQIVLLDVRNPNEFVASHYPGALNIPANELQARLSEVPTNKPVLVYCAMGIRAQRAYEMLKERRPDIKELYFIKGRTIFR